MTERYRLSILLLLYIVTSWFVRCHMAWGWTEPSWTPELRNGPVEPPQPTGTTFYVDAASLGGACSDSNPGTISRPWCTIGKAMATLTAGQMAFVRGGTYREGNFTPANSGTPGNYIIFRAYPGESPKIDCTGYLFCVWEYGNNDAQGQAIPGSARNYLVFDGLEMYKPNRGISTCRGDAGCHHMWFVNGTYHDTGLGESGPSFWSSIGDQHIIVSNNRFYNISYSAVGSSYASDMLVEFNEISNSGSDLDDGGLIGLHRGWNLIVRYNKVRDNQRNPNSPQPCWSCIVDPTDPNCGNYCQGNTGIYCDTCVDGDKGTRSYIYNNTVWNNDAGLQIFNSNGVSAFDNVVYHNGFTPGDGKFIWMFGKGLSLGPSRDVDIENNLFYDNRNAGFDFSISEGASVRSRNNIIMNNGGPEIYIDPWNNPSTRYDADYDIIVDTVYAGQPLISWQDTYSSLVDFRSRSGTTMWVNGKQVTPQFVAAGTGNFRPLASSSAVNAGTAAPFFNFDADNAARSQGTAWDIGPYEYGGSASTPNLSLAATPTTISSGQSSTLTWTGTNVTTCTASGGWSGSKPTSGTQGVNPSAPTTYNLSCSSGSGSVSQSVTVTVQVPQSALPLPGMIEAEAYRTGGEGIGYHDLSPGNLGGAGTRNDDVDLKEVAGEGLTVGYVDAGEWLSYDVQVNLTGAYQVSLRVARGVSGNGSCRLAIDGQPLGPAISIPATGSWSTQQTLSGPTVTLPTGAHQLTVVFDTDALDLNWLSITRPSASPSGDLDGNGLINLEDVRRMIAMLVGQQPVDLNNADLDTDGKVTLSDLQLLVKRIVAGP